MKGGENVSKKVRQFKCKKCGAVTKETDVHYKEMGLYLSLEKEGLCERCARGMS